jgi:ROK family protein
MTKRILVIDIGGSHVKLMISQRVKRRKFSSGPKMTARQFVAKTKKEVRDWKFDAIAIGFPAPVRDGKVIDQPKHLGHGWVGFDFRKAFGKPVRVMNDAAMQALGSYHGGRVLFLGMGTGLGSALVWKGNVLSLELSDLPYLDNLSVEDWLGDEGRESLGHKQWENEVQRVVPALQKALIAHYVVLGGGNAKHVDKLPKGVELGHNRNAFLGGVRLWETAPRSRQPKWQII